MFFSFTQEYRDQEKGHNTKTPNRSFSEIPLEDAMPRWERWWTKNNINQALRCACSIKDKNIDAYSRNRKVHSQSWKHGWKVIRLWNDVILMKDTSSGSWLELAWFSANWATSYIAQHQSRCQALRKAWFVPAAVMTMTSHWHRTMGCRVTKTYKCCGLCSIEKNILKFQMDMEIWLFMGKILILGVYLH